MMSFTPKGRPYSGPARPLGAVAQARLGERAFRIELCERMHDGIARAMRSRQARVSASADRGPARDRVIAAIAMRLVECPAPAIHSRTFRVIRLRAMTVCESLAIGRPLC